ncbi:MAG: CoA synthetase, partial [Aquificota bacterium]
MADYTVAELMAVCLAREIKDGDRVLQGLYSPLPMMACLLAKNFH